MMMPEQHHAFLKRLLRGGLYVLRNVLDPLIDFQEISILCYHSISDAQTPTTLTREMFERELSYLGRQGVSFVSLSAIVQWLRGDRELPRKAVALTFDDGYSDFETQALPILKKFAAPATLFISGDERESRSRLKNSIPLLSPDALARVRTSPLIEIGYHGGTHANLAELSGEALKKEITAPFRVRFYAYAGGNYSPEAMRALQESSYEAACSIKPTLVERGSTPFLLPRSVILFSMNKRDVHWQTTKAAKWYRILWRLV